MYFKQSKILIWHLREVHALSDQLDFTLICSQDGCPRTYQCINSFSKHLNRQHKITNDFEDHQLYPQPYPQPDPLHATSSELPRQNEAEELSNNNCCAEGIVEPERSLTRPKGATARFVAKMYSGSNVSLTDVTRTVNNVKDLMESTVSGLQDSVISTLKSLGVPENDERVQSLMCDFESAKHTFDEIDTPHKMSTYFSDKLDMVQPKEIFLGHRTDTLRKDGQIKQVLAPDTCQYIPIIDTIQFLFCNDQMQQLYFQSKKRKDNKMTDYSHGSRFLLNPLSCLHPDFLQIQLYYDDVETTNPLGSKTKIHKMGAVYFVIRNLPQQFTSSLSHIHLCLLFNSIDRETYGLGKIMEPLLEDLRQLESCGVDINVNGQNHKLYGTITVLTADNLAMHTLCGYVESFSANKPCQFCLIDKEEMQTVLDDDKVEMRTRQNYTEHAILCDASATGVKENSCLNTLKYFHVTENICADIMHDVLEGVAPLELKLLLRHLVYEEKCLTLQQLNNRIVTYDYGYSNIKNKPSVIVNLKSSEGAIRQTASQMWCLIQALPFLVGDRVDRSNEYWHLFILLREICSIIFAPVVTTGLAVFLKQVIIDHHLLFKKLYSRNLIPKHHFMTHYARLICSFGPISQLWCMRFEGKHNPFKRHAHVVCNFKNIAKTLAYKHQVQQLTNFKIRDPFCSIPDVNNAIPVLVGALQVPPSILDEMKEIIKKEFTMTSTIYVTHLIKHNGQEYRTGCVLSMKAQSHGECLFGEVLHLIPNEHTFLMVVTLLDVLYFDYHFYAYVVKVSKTIKLVILDDLADFRPLDIVRDFNSDKLYINPKYKIF